MENIMEKIITLENLRNFAYCNNHICKKPIRGIVIFFVGLGGMNTFDENTEDGRKYAEDGILYLWPYINPWAWMNRQTVSLVDEMVDVLMEAYGLPETTPIISTGGSMGGQCALVYTSQAKRTPAACVANCPVCDLSYHYTERPDLPRTLYSAFGQYEGTMEEALESASPLHLVEKMPTSASYYIFHCEEDEAVNKQLHSDRFVEKMKAEHTVSYFAVPGRGHCDLGEEMGKKYRECIMKAINK